MRSTAADLRAGRVQVVNPTNRTKPKMLFVHHGGELYGSDRVFAQTVRYASSIVDPIVILSKGGPLAGVLEKFTSEIHIHDLGVLRRKHFSLAGTLLTLWRLILAVFFLSRMIKRKQVRSVYTNTTSILSSAIAANLMRIRHVWHVHEIILTPKLLAALISWLVPRMSDMVVCNSRATMQHLLQDQIEYEGRVRVVHNGIEYERFAFSGTRESTRVTFGVKRYDVFVGVVGRVSNWKGQEYFLEAAAYLKDGDRRLVFGIIGDAYDRQADDQVLKLKRLAEEKGIASKVIFIEFQTNISRIYEALDIVVVPSILPEPFGLVSIEAMAASKPVIATAHGGSLEIVEDGITGFLAPVGEPYLLAQMIDFLAKDARLRRKMGYAGLQRVKRKFSQELYKRNIRKAIVDSISFDALHEQVYDRRR